jgi:hypothetical protein
MDLIGIAFIILFILLFVVLILTISILITYPKKQNVRSTGMRESNPNDINKIRLDDGIILINGMNGEVPQLIQKGRTCSLYALAMVMEYWHKLDASNPIYMVSSLDTVAAFGKPSSDEKILDYVEKSGMSLDGTIYSMYDLEKVANHFGYCATVHDVTGDTSVMYSILDGGHPVLIGFDCGNNGNPTEAGGDLGHCAVIESYYKQGSKTIFRAKHGWGTLNGVQDYLWTADELFDSMNNLVDKIVYVSNDSDKPGSLNTYPVQLAIRDKLLEIFPCTRANLQ